MTCPRPLVGGGPTLIDVSPFASTHSHVRTDFMHRTNPMTEWDNPLGLDGFEVVEFTGPDPAALANLFSAMGFPPAATHRSKKVAVYPQGVINFILNMSPIGQGAHFPFMPGYSPHAMASRVTDAPHDPTLTLKRGATPVQGKATPRQQ